MSDTSTPADAGKEEPKTETVTKPTPEEVALELEQTRAALKKANAEAADRRKKLEALEADETKRKEAELTEADKLKKQLAQQASALEQTTAELTTLRQRQSFGMTARKLALEFATPEAEDDAFRLADLSGVTVDDKGAISGMEAVLKSLQKAKAYLFKAGNGTTTTSPQTDAGRRGTQDSAPPTDEVIARKRRDYVPL